jgi:hypothetical protein
VIRFNGKIFLIKRTRRRLPSRGINEVDGIIENVNVQIPEVIHIFGKGISVVFEKG